MSVSIDGTVRLVGQLSPGLVEAHSSALYVIVKGCKYNIGGVAGTYSGSAAELMTDNTTNYLYLDYTGTFQKNTTGYPTTNPCAPLARVVTSSGEVVAIHDERVLVAASSTILGTCEISYPVDGDVRGGTNSASSNNDIAAVRYDANAESYNRWNRSPPKNYESGDVVLRVEYSFSASPGDTVMIWRWEWAFRNFGDALGSWDSYDEQNISTTGKSSDVLYYFDLTMPAATMAAGKSKNLMCLKLTRRGDQSGDTCDQHCYVHDVKLRYTGKLVAGQPGQ